MEGGRVSGRMLEGVQPHRTGSLLVDLAEEEALDVHVMLAARLDGIEIVLREAVRRPKLAQGAPFELMIT